MDCDIYPTKQKDGKCLWRCRDCAWQFAVPACEKVRYSCPTRPTRLGDLVAMGLAAIGLTQCRWKKLKKALGLTPRCGCDKRRRWLNSIHRAISAAWRGP